MKFTEKLNEVINGNGSLLGIFNDLQRQGYIELNHLDTVMKDDRIIYVDDEGKRRIMSAGDFGGLQEYQVRTRLKDSKSSFFNEPIRMFSKFRN